MEFGVDQKFSVRGIPVISGLATVKQNTDLLIELVGFFSLRG